MNAEERARARWANAPKRCAVKRVVNNRTLSCVRDEHPGGEHHDRRYGTWWEQGDRKAGYEFRTQVCDLDWQDRFTANPDAPAFYASYEVGRDSLLTVGPCGSVYMTKAQYKTFTDQLRRWADMIDKYMEPYENPVEHP